MSRWSVLTLAFVVAAPLTISAQVAPLRHDKGQPVVPFYEGWYRDPNGTVYVSFGYLNLNYSETVEIPTGPNNRIEPGPADQGQPTVFEPRRSVGVFTIRVPEGSKTEFAWTLVSRGRTTTIPATLDPLYEIYALKQDGARPAEGGLPVDNTPPSVKFTPTGSPGVGPAGARTSLRAQVSTPLTLDLWIADDGLPARGESPVGVSVAWSKYRGPGIITFTAARPKAEPADAGQKATTSVTFTEPGDYVLRALVSDGSGTGAQCCWTNAYASVTVSAGYTERR